MVNVKPVKLGNTERMSFGKIDEVIDMPNLIDIQKASYKWLLDEGLKEVLKMFGHYRLSGQPCSRFYRLHT